MAIGHSSGTLGLLSRTIHMPAIAWLLAVCGAEGLGMWPCFDIGCVGSADPSWQPFWPDVRCPDSTKCPYHPYDSEAFCQACLA